MDHAYLNYWHVLHNRYGQRALGVHEDPAFVTIVNRFADKYD